MPSIDDSQNEVTSHSEATPHREAIPRRPYRGEVRCSHTGELFHRDTDIYTSGMFSYKLNMWFSSMFNYNEYCFNHSIHAYEDAAYRNQMSKFFNKDRPTLKESSNEDEKEDED
jgi:hypothetical protein|tara:strand:- start:199 stop:540 length:342 start_codon:yes stop_codon:yes gene_type:complete